MELENILYILKLGYMTLYVVVFVLAIYKYHSYKFTFLKYFPAILFSNLIVEYIGDLLAVQYGINGWLYNAHSFIIFMFLLVLFYSALKTKVFKKTIISLAVLFLIICIYYAIDGNFILENQYQTFIAGSIISVICILLYYIEVLQSDAVIIIKYIPLFWISMGFLLYFIGSIPIEVIRNNYATESNSFERLKALQDTLNIIMNICFIVGFLVMKPKQSQLQ